MATPGTLTVRTFLDRTEGLAHLLLRADQAPRLLAFDDVAGCPVETALAALEWTRHPDGSLTLGRTLPNKVTLASKVVPGRDGVRTEFRVTNGGDRTLTGLRVQMCVMLAGLTGFEKPTNENKVFAAPFAACKDATGRRWVVTGWGRCGRAWGNPPCPCLHADPVLDDCPPGESRSVRGWLSFYEGTNIDGELKRLAKVAFE